MEVDVAIEEVGDLREYVDIFPEIAALLNKNRTTQGSFNADTAQSLLQKHLLRQVNGCEMPAKLREGVQGSELPCVSRRLMQFFLWLLVSQSHMKGRVPANEMV